MKVSWQFHGPTVWPPWVLVVLFTFTYGMSSAFFWFVQRVVEPMSFADMPEVVRVRAVIIGAAAVVFAFYRVLRFHPGCSQAYADWLKLSPWEPQKPLPLGPVLPVWQDAVTIGALSGIAVVHAHVNPQLPLVAFVGTYLGVMSVVLLSTRQWPVCIALGFLWPALLLPDLNFFGVESLMAVIAIVVFVGYRHSLTSFPWIPVVSIKRMSASTLQTEINFDAAGEPEDQRQLAKAGWPYWVLSAKYRRQSITTRNGAVISAMATWLCYCLIKSTGAKSQPELAVAVVLVAAVVRTTVYLVDARPPFNILGRLRTGRIVVPGFDQVFLAPILAGSVATLADLVVRFSGDWFPMTEAGVVGMCLCILLNTGPSLKTWMLTGQNRLATPALKTSSTQQALRSI